MFKICADPKLQEKLNNPQKYFPSEVCQELNQFLKVLERDGQFTKTDFYDINTNKIPGITCSLFYRPDFVKGEVLIIDVKIKQADLFKTRFKITDDWDDKNVVESIPQYDQPKKIVKALVLIHQGITDSYNLGYALGHTGKKKEYISRHGQYAQHALEQLKLIVRKRQGRQLSPELTEKGRLIAEGFDEDLQFRLLIEAMLNYPPVWRIITAVSEKESQLDNEPILNDDLVKKLAFPEILRAADTSNRRSQTLKNWIKWIAKYSGIPIRLHKGGVQLTIPMLYSEGKKDENADTD
ncbi:MAG: hypothetical protein RIM23_26820 [Coleofasciculus sp. G3-WIS-01]|uniref:DUF7226 domain-containing protein n=1 Tax=Coleofasciculus sp. G3-WIS-01 TaxID=3069528 RepID=UPI0032F459D5